MTYLDETKFTVKFNEVTIFGTHRNINPEWAWKLWLNKYVYYRIGKSIKWLEILRICIRPASIQVPSNGAT